MRAISSKKGATKRVCDTRSTRAYRIKYGFVFSSLLTQHQFPEGSFGINSLSRPEALSNYQSRLTVEQVVFDARQTNRSVEAARWITRRCAELLIEKGSITPAHYHALVLQKVLLYEEIPAAIRPRVAALQASPGASSQRA